MSKHSTGRRSGAPLDGRLERARARRRLRRRPRAIASMSWWRRLICRLNRHRFYASGSWKAGVCRDCFPSIKIRATG